MMAPKDRSARVFFWIFVGLAIAVPLFLLVIAVIVVPLQGGFSPAEVWTQADSWQALGQRSPSIVQAFGNLLLLELVFVCGMILCTRRLGRSRVLLRIVAAIALICAVLLHSMVWGIDLFVPSSHSLLAPYQRPMLLFPVQLIGIYGNGVVIDSVLSAFIHLFAPQVLLPIVIGIVAARRASRLRVRMPLPE
jgi:Ni/Fe-hydrogenase subunit HybB-like protein